MPNQPSKEKLWVYTVLPPLILNIGGLFTYGLYYALLAVNPQRVAGISPGHVRLAADAMIFIVEWVFAAAIIFSLRKSGANLNQLISPQSNLFHFRWGPAVLLFAGWNALFAVYLYLAGRINPAIWNAYQGLPLGLHLLEITLIPFTAAFCEELIWRAYIPTRMEVKGSRLWPIILLSSFSFCLIHGVFLVDKLFVTFILGVMATFYYLKKRNLVPLIITHWFIDLWSFGLFIFR